MKNTTWRRVGYCLAIMMGFGIGVIVGEYFLLNWVGRLIIKLFQLSPEQATNFYNELMQNVRFFLQRG